MLFQPNLLLLILMTPRLFIPGFELLGLCFPVLTLMSQCSILRSPFLTKYLAWKTENMKHNCWLGWSKYKCVQWGWEWQPWGGLRSCPTTGGVCLPGFGHKTWDLSLVFQPDPHWEISKLQTSSVWGSRDAGADSASPVLLQHLPSSPALASPGKEEKIAAQMFSNSVSTAASASADRQTSQSLITALCSVFWEIQQNPFNWLGSFSH